MIMCICLMWIGAKLSAPWWYYTLLAVIAVVRIIDLGIKIGKAAKE